MMLLGCGMSGMLSFLTIVFNQLPILTTSMEVAIADKNPVGAINRRVMQIRHNNGVNGCDIID